MSEVEALSVSSRGIPVTALDRVGAAEVALPLSRPLRLAATARAPVVGAIVGAVGMWVALDLASLYDGANLHYSSKLAGMAQAPAAVAAVAPPL